MTLLLPLGLIGLLGVVALIIIYIIKPNFQQKFISSTFVWKLSLKYRKKRIPTSKLRNILLILCQVLILTLCAMILARPSSILKYDSENYEVIAVIDSSASMRTSSGGQTRFERAIKNVYNLVDETFAKNGVMSIIIAEEEGRFLIERADIARRDEVYDALADISNGETLCSYGVSDVNQSMNLCGDILAENPSTEIYVYSDAFTKDTPSFGAKAVNLVPVLGESEWNVAILDAKAEFVDNFYQFTVDVACYGRDADVDINIMLDGVNPEEGMFGTMVEYTQTITCQNDKTYRVVFSGTYEGAETDNSGTIYYEIEDVKRAYEYNSATITVSAASGRDSLTEDDTFMIYGKKETIKVQYSSLLPNPFFPSVLTSIANQYKYKWNLDITEIKEGELGATRGFDFYIFEHYVPDNIPGDGIVMLVNPQSLPQGMGIRFGGVSQSAQSVPCAPETEHQIMNNVTAENITLTAWTRITSYPAEEYVELMSCANYPVMIAQDSGPEKVVIMPFSLHYSNLPILKEFPLVMNNIFNYYFPLAVGSKQVDANKEIVVNGRGEALEVVRVEGDIQYGYFEQFPQKIKLDIPGSYLIDQATYYGHTLSEYVFVRVPESESNIFTLEETLNNPFKEKNISEYYGDLMLYFAIALVSLVFIEWLLQCKANM